jgi:SAM-dependent methyltransferase
MAGRTRRAPGARAASAGGHRLRRLAGAGLWGLAAVQVVEALALRRAHRSFDRLPAPPDPDPESEPESGDGAAAGTRAVRVLSAPGVRVGAATRAAAAAEMEATGGQAVDLIPADLPPDLVLGLLRRVSPVRLGEDPLYAPAGAHEALVLSAPLARRIGADGDACVDRDELVRATRRAQRYAPAAVAVRLVPGLGAAPRDPRDRWRTIEELTAYLRPYGALAPVLVGAEAAFLLALTAGPAVAPVPAVAALAAWSAQPLVVLGGRAEGTGGGSATGVRALAGAGMTRLARAWSENVRTALAGYRETRARAARRTGGTTPAAPRPDELFDPRRERCPWCCSPLLRGCLDTTDLLFNKPGTFHLDECLACGHIFQNPALSPLGLAHYYDAAGSDEEWNEAAFGANGDIYDRRAEVVARFVEPRAWLDVGTAGGQFCLVARQRWPKTTFDGLDMSAAVEEAQRRGWVDTAYRTPFLDLADRMPHRYDVVSMFHYLEHTRDPRRELAAAARVLEPGGHLVVEMPDPATPWSRRLGRFWLPWLQPQHQHFVTCANLVTALGDAGFDVVSVERAETGTGGRDFVSAVALVLQHLAPSPHLPWRPPASAARRARRLALAAASVPVAGLALAADGVQHGWWQRHPGTPGNAYRVVARTPDD